MDNGVASSFPVLALQKILRQAEFLFCDCSDALHGDLFALSRSEEVRDGIAQGLLDFIVGR